MIASVLDLFCGAGGLSHGFLKGGFHLAGGIDIDKSCCFAYEQNNNAPFVERDIRKVKGAWLKNHFPKWKGPRILAGCAPCQPFSTYNPKNDDPNWSLLEEFSRIVKETRPEIVTMENVPNLQSYQGGHTLDQFITTLERAKYNIWQGVIDCRDYGLPQRRKRLVILASRLGKISFIPPTHTPSQYKTVKDTISNLPPLASGKTSDKDNLHRSSHLSPLNMKRIKQSKQGGTWRDWDNNLVASCHRKATGRTYSSVYGRMCWDKPSPTITTQFYGFGTGRFGHPKQNRALSLREGALLQGFPRNYRFIAPDQPLFFRKTAQLIGNAVPVHLARAIANSIRRHLEEYK